MFLQVSLLTLAVLHVAHSAPLKDEKINPVDLKYVCIHMQEKGKENNKSPVLLLHGLTDTLHTWKGVQQVLALRTGRKICAVDLRNHGDSPWSNETGIEAFTADLGHFLDEQKFEKVNLIGHSLGGKISIHYALNNPERVDSLVVEDMTPNNVNLMATMAVQYFAKIILEALKLIPEVTTEEEARKIVVDYLNKKLDELGFEDDIDEETSANLKFRCQNGKCEFKTNPYLLYKVAEDPDSLLIKSEGLYEGPTLFIYGKLSFFHVNEDEKNILELFPNAKLVGVEGAGHSIHGKHREFEDEVIRFLNK